VPVVDQVKPVLSTVKRSSVVSENVAFVKADAQTGDEVKPIPSTAKRSSVASGNTSATKVDTFAGTMSNEVTAPASSPRKSFTNESALLEVIEDSTVTATIASPTSLKNEPVKTFANDPQSLADESQKSHKSAQTLSDSSRRTSTSQDSSPPKQSEETNAAAKTTSIEALAIESKPARVDDNRLKNLRSSVETLDTDLTDFKGEMAQKLGELESAHRRKESLMEAQIGLLQHSVQIVKYVSLLSFKL
jgi:hypothetical protein